MKTIIVATDFSSSALNAGKYALKMAALLQADVLLLNVFEVLSNYKEVVFAASVDEIKKNAESSMQKFKNELISATGSNASIKTEVKLGGFENELTDLCELLEPYVIIMGSQGKTAGEHFLKGTHAGNALEDFRWPIITVPVSTSFTTINNIGIAYDFVDPLDKTFIEHIKVIANDFNAAIHIVNAASEDEFNNDFITLSAKLEKMFLPQKLHFHFVEGNQVDKSVIEFADKSSIDILIVMPKHHSLWERIMNRSHTKQLVLNSHVPVLLLSK